MWPAIFMGMAALKSGQDKRNADSKRKIDATRMENSPLTGENTANLGNIKEPDTMGTMMQGAMAAAKFSQDNPAEDTRQDASAMSATKPGHEYMKMSQDEYFAGKK